MEPERKIENLLRAYAKKRRTQAGEPLELHPAARRILRDEIARRTLRPDEEGASLTLWELFRRQWAFLLSFAVIIFLGVALFAPALSSSKLRSQQVAAMNNLRQIGMAAQIVAQENNGQLPVSLDALTNQLASANIFTDAESGKRFIYLAAGKNLDDLSSNFVLAFSPADKKVRPVLFADGRVEVVNGAQLSELTNQNIGPLASADMGGQRRLAESASTITVAKENANDASATFGPAKSKDSQSESKLSESRAEASEPAPMVVAAPLPASALDQTVMMQTNSTQFASATGTGTQNLFKNTSVPAKTKAVSVLANFQVRQDGNAIRVVDADGSVYDGFLLPQNAVAQQEPVSAEKLAAPPAGTAQFEQSQTIASQNAPAAAQGYFFRVAGWNQTLKQNVVFTGNCLAIPDATGLQQTSGNNGNAGAVGGSAAGETQSTPASQLPWVNSRIAGTAVIGNTNNIEINAVPVLR